MTNHDDLLTEAVTISPQHWTKEHIEVLPRKYLLDNVSTFTLYSIWQDLRDELKGDLELQSHLPCLEHYNQDEDFMHIDGPPPPKYRCPVCRRLQRETKV